MTGSSAATGAGCGWAAEDSAAITSAVTGTAMAAACSPTQICGSGERTSRDTSPAAAPTDDEARSCSDKDADGASTGEPSDPRAAGEPSTAPLRVRDALSRAAMRDGRVVEPGEAESAGATDPAEPVVSAKATTGIAPTAKPTPSATARAPTRPTYLADPDGSTPPVLIR